MAAGRELSEAGAWELAETVDDLYLHLTGEVYQGRCIMKMRRNCVRILACVGLCLDLWERGLQQEGMDFPVVYESGRKYWEFSNRCIHEPDCLGV